MKDYSKFKFKVEYNKGPHNILTFVNYYKTRKAAERAAKRLKNSVVVSLEPYQTLGDYMSNEDMRK